MILDVNYGLDEIKEYNIYNKIFTEALKYILLELEEFRWTIVTRIKKIIGTDAMRSFPDITEMWW